MGFIFYWVLLTSFLLRVFTEESLESPCIDFFSFFSIFPSFFSLNFRLGGYGWDSFSGYGT